MKNLFFAIVVSSILLFQSCSPNSGAAVGLLLIAIATGNGDFYAGDYAETPSSIEDPLSKNWSIDNSNFENPILHNESIIYFDNGVHSIDKNSGQSNWSVDLGPISTFVQPVLLDNTLYFVQDNEIYVIDLGAGQLLHKIAWKRREDIFRNFTIFENRLYVVVKHKELEYSAIASNDLSTLDSGTWDYHRLVKSEDQNGELDFMSKCLVKKNATGDLLLLTVVERGDFSNSISTRTEWVEAYNITKEEVEWATDQAPESLISNQFFLQDQNFVLRGINFLWNLDADTGTENWLHVTSAHIFDVTVADRVLFYDDIVLLINDSQLITAYDIKTGGKKWVLNQNENGNEGMLEGILKGTANIVENKLYYLSANAILVSVDLERGRYETFEDNIMFSGGLIAIDESTLVGRPNYINATQLVSFNVDF